MTQMYCVSIFSEGVKSENVHNVMLIIVLSQDNAHNCARPKWSWSLEGVCTIFIWVLYSTTTSMYVPTYCMYLNGRNNSWSKSFEMASKWHGVCIVTQVNFLLLSPYHSYHLCELTQNCGLQFWNLDLFLNVFSVLDVSCTILRSEKTMKEWTWIGSGYKRFQGE